ncbi:hypothetical protein HWV62_11772 [Athelia sp. TMB]|nr:hypothetical protein HWV62_11772 [Athelia sp. TMB]
MQTPQPATEVSTGIRHNARNHISDNYVLPADDSERERLNSQHRVLKQSFDGRLILAPVILKSGDRVLDSGTGAGSWLIDFASEVQSTISIYGIDISTRLFPSDPPPNVSFLNASITQLPEDWTSTFALVNQRLLFGGLTAAAWQAAFSVMYRVLVPGGWVNLYEFNGDIDRMGWEPGPSTKKMFLMTRETYRRSGVLIDAVYHLPGWLKGAGFINIHTELKTVPMNGEKGKPMRENKCSALAAMKTPALRAGGFGFVHSEEDFDNLVAEMRNELVVTEDASIHTFMIYAQKPVSGGRE